MISKKKIEKENERIKNIPNKEKQKKNKEN